MAGTRENRPCFERVQHEQFSHAPLIFLGTLIVKVLQVYIIAENIVSSRSYHGKTTFKNRTRHL